MTVYDMEIHWIAPDGTERVIKAMPRTHWVAAGMAKGAA